MSGSPFRSRSRSPWCVAPARVRALADAGLRRENYAGRERRVPGRARCWSRARWSRSRRWRLLDDRADLDLLDPELRRWFVYVARRRPAGPARRRARPRRRGGHRARLARARARRARRRLLHGAIKAVGRACAGRLRDLGPRPRGHRLRRRPRAAAAGHQPLQPARPAARPGREGVLRCCWRRPLPRRLDAWRRSSCSGCSSARSSSAPYFTLRERAMLGDTGSNLVGALAGIAMLVTLADTGRWIALGAGRRAHDLRGVSVDLRRRSTRFRHCAPRLARQSESRLSTKR